MRLFSGRFEPSKYVFWTIYFFALFWNFFSNMLRPLDLKFGDHTCEVMRSSNLCSECPYDHFLRIQVFQSCWKVHTRKRAITFFLGNLRTIPYAHFVCLDELYLMHIRIFELVDSKWPKSKKAQKRHLEGSNRPENRRI